MVSIKWLKLKTKYTVLDMRKGRLGRKAINIAVVRRSLKKAVTKEPGKPGPSARRHTEAVS